MAKALYWAFPDAPAGRDLAARTAALASSRDAVAAGAAALALTLGARAAANASGRDAVAARAAALALATRIASLAGSRHTGHFALVVCVQLVRGDCGHGRGAL